MKKTLIILIALFVIVSSNISRAEVFLAHCRDSPPELSFVDNTCVGVIPELVNDLINELGHEVVWVKVPWIRSIKLAEEGKVDLIVRHSLTPERTMFLNGIPYGYDARVLSFYKSPKLTAKITSYADIEKHRIGALRGNFYSKKLSSLDANVLTVVGTNEQLVGMLALSRIDLVVTSRVHNEELYKGRFTKADFEDSFQNPMHISTVKNSKASKYHQEIEELLLEYRKSKKINQYFEKYGLPAPKQVFE